MITTSLFSSILSLYFYQEICSNPKLIVDGLDPSDLNQGAVGNCWFVAACSALALERRLWNKVVVDVNDQVKDEARTNQRPFHTGISNAHCFC